MLPKCAWSGSREQFLHCGLRKFRHSKSSVYSWYTQLDRRRFVYETWDNGSRIGRVMVECTLFMTHCLRLNLQLHTISLVRTCHISSFCTVAWQLARFQLTRRIARSLGDSWASCAHYCRPIFQHVELWCCHANIIRTIRASLMPKLWKKSSFALLGTQRKNCLSFVKIFFLFSEDDQS